MSVHFEERSGVIPCKTPWGSWYQTMEEVFIEVSVPHGTSAKEVKCHLGSRDIELSVRGKEVFKVSCWTDIWLTYFIMDLKRFVKRIKKLIL